MKNILATILLVALSAPTLLADETIKKPVYTDEGEKAYVEKSPFQYVGAMRAGDMVYVSGAIAGKSPRHEGEFTIKDYNKSLERAFDQIKERLEAAGGTMDHIVHMRTFHMFGSEILPMNNQEHIKAVANVKSRYIKPPFHSWTAIGTSGLFAPYGLVEIEVVAHIPEEQ